jgi:hypothetical protein
MPAVYENLGVRFLYPENWSITDEEDDGWPRSVTVQSQETGFWSLHVYPPRQETKGPVDELIAAIQAEFGEVEVLPAKESFGETATSGVDLAFFYLDLLIEAKIRFVHAPAGTLVWLYQAESREFEKMEPVFQAIAVSMLSDDSTALESGQSTARSREKMRRLDKPR